MLIYAGSPAQISDAVDQHARRAPFFKSYSIPALTDYLTRDCSNDLEKVRSIYVWITCNIKYDVKSYIKGTRKIYPAKKTLKRRKAICSGYSILFKAMCELAGINAEIVYGYDKGMGYYEGKIYTRAEHAWNAVQIDGKWHLLDLTWGSGYIIPKERILRSTLFTLFGIPYLKNKLKFIRSANDLYYLSNPKFFIRDHMPTDPMWQLLKCPVPLKTFEEGTNYVIEYIYQTSKENSECFNYNDSIDIYRYSEPYKRELKTGISGYLFNERNKEIRAYGHNNHAVELSHAVFNYIDWTSSEKLEKYNIALTGFDSSLLYLDKAIEQNRKEYKTRSNVIKEHYSPLILESSRYAGKDKSLIKSNRRKVKVLKKRIKALHKMNITLAKENGKLDNNITKTRRSKEEMNREIIFGIQDKFAQIISNNNHIENLQLEININHDQTAPALREDLAGSRDTINAKNNVNTGLTHSNSHLRIEFNYDLDKIIYKQKAEVRLNKRLESHLRTANDSIEKILDRDIHQAMRRNTREIKKLIKDNRKMLKDIKRLSKHNLHEDEQYTEETRRIENQNNRLMRINSMYMGYYSNDIAAKKLDNSFLRQEKKQFRKNTRIEKFRMKHEMKLVKLRYQWYDKRNKSEKQKCKENRRTVNKLVRELENELEKETEVSLPD